MRSLADFYASKMAQDFHASLKKYMWYILYNKMTKKTWKISKMAQKPVKIRKVFVKGYLFAYKNCTRYISRTGLTFSFQHLKFGYCCLKFNLNKALLLER